MRGRNVKGLLAVGALVLAGVLVAVQLGNQLEESQAEVPVPEAAETELPGDPADDPEGSTSDADLGAGSSGTRQCGTEPGDETLGETVFVDLDGDGRDEAIAARRQAQVPGDVVEYSVMVGVGACGWRPVGVLRHGSSGYSRDGGIVERWTCVGAGTGEDRTVRLVQIRARTSPAEEVFVQQFELRDGGIFGHQPTVISSTLLEYDADRAEGAASLADNCAKGSGNERFTAQYTASCGGQNWTIELPAGWKTALVGAAACSEFSVDSLALPCDCDTPPEISVRFLSTAEFEASSLAQSATGWGSTTTVDGYQTAVVEQTTIDDTGTRRTLSHIVDVGKGHVVFTASDINSQLAWPGLSGALELIVEGTTLHGFPPAAALFLDVANLDPSRFVSLSTDGGYAVYGSELSAEPSCSARPVDHLFLLQIDTSAPADLYFEAAGFSAVGNMSNVTVDDAGSGFLRVECRTETGTRQTTDYEIDIDQQGFVATATEVDSLEGDTERLYAFTEPAPFRTPDGKFRYTVADDPQGRSAIRCGNADPPIGKTLLRHGPDDIEVAFRDEALVGGGIGRMVFGQDNLVVWQQNTCQSTGLYAGRIDETGHIVDRHRIRLLISQRWVLNEENQIVIVGTESISYEAGMLDERGQPFENTSTLTPTIDVINVDNSPGWAMTAPGSVQLREQLVARSIDDSAAWHLGTQPNGSGDCPGHTVYVDHPDGLARVLDGDTQIHGDIVQVLVSEIVDGGMRAVVVRARCVGDGSVSQVWFGLEYERFAGSQLTLYPADLEAAQSIEEVILTPTSSAGSGHDVVVIAVDAAGDTIEAILRPVD